MTEQAPQLIREMVRLYVRAQRKRAKCGDGASTVQCHVMTELLREDGIAQQVLAERLGLDKGWISRAVGTLVSDGCLVKQTADLDRRSVTLSLTSEGRARAHALENELNGHAAGLLGHVTPDRRVQVQESLQLLVDALSKSEPRPAEGSFGCGVLAIRTATIKDWPGIKRMLQADGLPAAGARDHLEHFLVGEAAGKLVCVGGLEVYGADALLRSVVVANAWRDRGWGRQLLLRLTVRATELGATSLYLLTTTAEAYFARLGFSAVSRGRIPAQLARSRELQDACPASAIAMMKPIGLSKSV